MRKALFYLFVFTNVTFGACKKNDTGNSLPTIDKSMAEKASAWYDKQLKIIKSMPLLTDADATRLLLFNNKPDWDKTRFFDGAHSIIVPLEPLTIVTVTPTIGGGGLLQSWASMMLEYDAYYKFQAYGFENTDFKRDNAGATWYAGWGTTIPSTGD